MRRHKLTIALSALCALGLPALAMTADHLAVAPAAETLAVSEYFVAPGGSNQNPGTISAPFKTIAHCALEAPAGSTCSVRAGIYRETVVPNSGLTIAAYQGEDVTVSGANPVMSWTARSDGTYTANISLPTSGYSTTGFFANQLFANGQMMPEARWPNAGATLLDRDAWAAAAAGSGPTALYDPTLPSITGGYAGAMIYFKGTQNYTSQSSTITSSGPGSLGFDKSTVDTTNAWNAMGEPRRVCRRLFGLSHAAIAGCSIIA